MIMIGKDENIQYICTQPKEYRLNLRNMLYQWVVEFTICDEITTEKIDDLLNTRSLTFIYYDDNTKETLKRVTIDDYIKINTISITYNQDLSCTAFIQLGKEVEGYAIEV